MASEYNIFNLKELNYVVDLFQLPTHTKKSDLVSELINGGYTITDVRVEIDAWENNPQLGRLDKIEERQREERQREERLEMARLEAQIKIAEAQGQSSISTQNLNSNGNICLNMSKYLQAFKDDGDMGSYLTNFERVCTQLEFSKETWAIRLTSILSPKANEVIARLSESDAKDYGKVRASLLKKFRLTSEVFRNKFRYGKRNHDQSYAEFAYQLKINFNEWVKCEEIGNDFEKLVQLVCLDKFYNSISNEMRFWLEDHNHGKTIEDAGELADVYVSKRGPMLEKFYSNQGYYKNTKNKSENKKIESNQDEQKGKIQETTEGKHSKGIDKSSFEKRRAFRCYGCGAQGHFKNSPECPKVKPVSAVVEAESEPLSLFKPYMISATINGKNIQLLRDSAAGFDMVHSKYIRSRDFVGKFVHVRGVLSEESVALPVARVVLNCSELGEITTEAAVPDTLPFAYLLSNRTWENWGKENMEVMPVFALTRSKARKLMENEDKQVQKERLSILAKDAETDNSSLKEMTSFTEEMENPEKEKKEEDEENLENENGSDINTEEILVLPSSEKDFSDITKLTPTIIRKLQMDDTSLEHFFDLAEKTEEFNNGKFYISHGILHRRFTDKLGRSYEQVVVPKKLRANLMEIAHDNMWMGHLGCNKTIQRLKQNYWWKRCQNRN